MSFTFLTLVLISFSCDLLRILFRQVEQPEEAREMAEEVEHRKVAIISAVISAHTSTDPGRLAIRKISAEAPGSLKRGDAQNASPLSRELLQKVVKPTISPWTLTGREELMEMKVLGLDKRPSIAKRL